MNDAALEIGLSPTGTVFVAPAPPEADGAWHPPVDMVVDMAPEAIFLRLASGKFTALPPAWGFWRDFALQYIT